VTEPYEVVSILAVTPSVQGFEAHQQLGSAGELSGSRKENTAVIEGV
jgi:hypothetical protein